MLSPFEQLFRRLSARSSINGYQTDAFTWLRLMSDRRHVMKISEGVLRESELFREPMPPDLCRSDTHKLFRSGRGRHLIVCERIADHWRIPAVRTVLDHLKRLIGRPYGPRFRVVGIESSADRIGELQRRYVAERGLEVI